MPRLLTGEFNSGTDADRVIDDLVRAGIPREQIYIETELPEDTERGRRGGEVTQAEAERRIAGLQTGALVGGILGMMAGLGLETMNHMYWLMSGGDRWMVWPFNSIAWSIVAGLVIGLAIGAALGATIDATLTRLGAGPAKPREEC